MPHKLELMPLEVTLPPETGTTFAENALAKARVVAEHTGRRRSRTTRGSRLPPWAALRASCRRATPAPDATDEDNLEHLLAETPDGSAVRYVCALAVVDPERGEEHVFHGFCSGTLTSEPRGSGGFGYDPAFVPDDDHSDRTMAELAPAEKDAISHRGRAARELLAWLAQR